jgi:hypothetical protein
LRLSLERLNSMADRQIQREIIPSLGGKKGALVPVPIATQEFDRSLPLPIERDSTSLQSMKYPTSMGSPKVAATR